MNDKIDELSKVLFDGSTKAFSQLRRLEMIIVNVKIATSKLADSPDTRALSKTGDIIERALRELESSTKEVRDIAKEIGVVNREG